MNVHCNCSLPVEYVPYVSPCTLNKCTFSMSFIELYRYKIAAWSIKLQFTIHVCGSFHFRKKK
jgi:hypothetical protein